MYTARAAMLLPEALLPMLALFLSTSSSPVLAAATISAAGRLLPPPPPPVPEGQYPLDMPIPEPTWQPRETGSGWAAVGVAATVGGFSPRPTDGPRLGGMLDPMDLLLLRRQDVATLQPNQCGFLPDGNPFVCPGEGASCKHDGTHLGCCVKDGSCRFRAKSCIDFKASTGGACKSITDPATRCCSESTIGFCFTLQFSTSTEPGKILTLLDCQESPGTAILYNTPPPSKTTATSKKTTAPPKTSTKPTTSSTGSAPDPTSSNGGNQEEQQQQPPPSSSKASVGAIAGGVVGGVALLGLVAAAAFFLIRRRNRAAKAGNPTSPSSSSNGVAAAGGTYPPTSPYQTHMSANYASTPADPNTPFGQEQQKQGWHPNSNVSSMYGSPQPTPMTQTYVPYRPPAAPAELEQTNVVHEMPGESAPRR